MLSVGVFAKRFDSPIERIEQATSGAYQARFQNALSAVNAGVELELRKQLGFLGGWAAHINRPAWPITCSRRAPV